MSSSYLLMLALEYLPMKILNLPIIKVAECITGEGRRIHKEMESKGQKEPYNFTIVFGFTDSTF